MSSLTIPIKLFFHPTPTTSSFLHSQSQTKPQTLTFIPTTTPTIRASASASENPQKQHHNPPNTPSDADKGINPVGFLVKRGISHKAFGQFLRERHKALKDLKDEIFNRHANLKELASGFELLGMHRHPEHRVDYMEWAPGARYCAIVADFNGWSPTENCAREGYFGHDDYGYWFVILQDKLREGEEPDELYFQQYNYVDDYDKGDSGITIDEIFKKANDEYWQPGEDRYLNNRLEGPVKLYEEIFGPNGPQTMEELGDIPDAETRYKEWVEKHGPSRYAVIDEGKEYDIFNVKVDPEWYEQIRALKPPIPYWFETRKGRKAWLKKYIPGVPHGSMYRVYFDTPNGPLERVPAWATYVQPGGDGVPACAIHWEPSPEQAYKWKNKSLDAAKSLRIYEAHVGISGSEPKISSFNDFTDKVLPHIKEAGYNAIQLIGVVEHKDYFTVGYRVVPNVFDVCIPTFYRLLIYDLETFSYFTFRLPTFMPLVVDMAHLKTSSD
ncbi:1,4-alpha-glucan-branching enzyme 3, chloroplastic/amyloplastic [Stylosanthes scabra]|uniref:1,4-alpha-glucan-branching enzyme 3, chloroplastic/amyloplastic n=1 Tax=Stylosanthes scabra TaxID=79078 RepID=A0ABU6TB40_9FABA|nr:1,4-alpha-glucan-branching enzyme 3, chloroplastic/amyloplastic [Stylosanthes scabra]